MATGDWPWSDLPTHAAVIDELAQYVVASDRWRWFEICCSLAAGRGDELSDIDGGIGYTPEQIGDLEEAATTLIQHVGDPAAALVHVPDGWPVDTRRIAAELGGGVQLDLVLMPADRRVGLPTGSIAVVDKDDRLARPWQPPVELPPTPALAREWMLLGWWAISDTAKYLRRGSVLEAVDRLHEARMQAFRILAAGEGTPFPSFGLVSLLDFPPFEVPVDPRSAYALPSNPAGIRLAALAAADLLGEAAARASARLGMTLETSWEENARQRLAALNATGAAS